MPTRPSGSSARALVVGDVMTDIICKPEGPLVIGSDRRATIRSHPGGSGANQGVWLAAFGVAVRFAARVGAGDVAYFNAQFAGLGVEPRLAADPVLASGALVTIVDPDGERSFLTDRGANAGLSIEDLPDALLDAVEALVISGYSLFEPGPRAAVMRLMAAAGEHGIPVSIDPASVGFLTEVGPANFLGWTRQATTIFANEAEAATLTGEILAAAQIKALHQTYRRVVLKRGADGAILSNGTQPVIALPAPKVAVVDTTGAGDAFAAAFIAAELDGKGPEACLRRAIAAGADAVQRLGGQPRGRQ
ncbi:MAG TPA: PfkB family carbohydrate kinase [Devosiaceae bacterium]|nr:PfkB family carbohydrate kinase [Devosiaceae bacterium]